MRPNGLRRMRMRGCQAPGCWRPGIGKPGSTRPFHPGLILELEAKPWAKKRSPPNDNKEDSWGDGLYWPQLSPRPTLNPLTRHTGHATPMQALLVTSNNHLDVMAAHWSNIHNFTLTLSHTPHNRSLALAQQLSSTSLVSFQVKDKTDYACLVLFYTFQPQPATRHIQKYYEV